MLDYLVPAVATGLFAFLDEERQFRVLVLALGVLACLLLLSIHESLQEVTALGYEIRNLRAYYRPRTSTPVAHPGSPETTATPPQSEAAGLSVQTPATEGTEQSL